MIELAISPYTPFRQKDVLALTVDAWSPVFAKTKNDVPKFVFDAFYPAGWQSRQTAEVASLLAEEPNNVWLALFQEDLAGFIGLRLHPDDQMGEIFIIAVSPDFQRQGVGRQLMQFAEKRIRAEGMKMVMVETIADKGHEPAQLAYEAFGFQRWPVARYFKEL